MPLSAHGPERLTDARETWRNRRNRPGLPWCECSRVSSVGACRHRPVRRTAAAHGHAGPDADPPAHPPRRRAACRGHPRSRLALVARPACCRPKGEWVLWSGNTSAGGRYRGQQAMPGAERAFRPSVSAGAPACCRKPLFWVRNLRSLCHRPPAPAVSPWETARYPGLRCITRRRTAPGPKARNSPSCHPMLDVPTGTHSGWAG